MSYSLFWNSPALPYTQKQTAITVPAGSVVSNAASLRFTGKGAANYGKIQQENQMRLLENFAGPTAPSYPTVGQTWYDTTEGALKVCVATAPQTTTWRSMKATQITEIGEDPPTPAVLGDTWYQKTGSASGILYLYTGLGRYPEVDWDATAASYFPAASVNKLGIKRNQSTFSASANSNYSEAYIHGYTGTTAADVDGSIVINSVTTSVPRGVLFTRWPVSNGYILWDSTGTLVSTGGTSHFFSVRQIEDGTWQYDNNTSWIAFTPVSGMYAIGLINVAEQDDNTAPGISSATIWGTAADLLHYSQVPNTLTDGAIGGWTQVFPTVDMGAGRDEYDYVMGLVAQLLGDPLSFGGAGALGRVMTLSPMNTLDASLRKAWNTILPVDQNVLYDSSYDDKLLMEPNSQDWDRVLSAIRYAVDRLELPSTMLADVSDLPFVQDGRQAPSDLLSIAGVRYPSDRRLANRRAGSITMSRLFQETVNVLNAAIMNRYMLKGMLGNSGTNTAFNSVVSTDAHASFQVTNPGSLFTSTATHAVQFNFSSTLPNLEWFFSCGQAVELIVRHVPSGSPTSADTNLKNLTDTKGRFRILNDTVIVMDSSNSPSVTQAPGALGFANTTTSAAALVAVTGSGSAALTLRAQRVSLSNFKLMIDVIAGGSTTGNFLVTWNLIKDNEVYASGPNVGNRIYPVPSTFVAGDQTGSTSFVYQA